RLVHRRRARRVAERPTAGPGGEGRPAVFGHLADARLAPVADARRERREQPRLLVEVERHAAVGGIAEVQWLELALEDVFGERATRHLPRRTLERHGTRRRAESDIVQRLGPTGIGQAHVGGAGGLVGAHLLLDRAVARIVLDVREPLVEGEKRPQRERGAGWPRAAVARVRPDALV